MKINRRVRIAIIATLAVVLTGIATRSHETRRVSTEASSTRLTNVAYKSALTSGYAVYLYVNGIPEDESAIDSYEEPVVFDNVTEEQIGTVPDQAAGWIVDSNHNVLGYISPSAAATGNPGP